MIIMTIIIIIIIIIITISTIIIPPHLSLCTILHNDYALDPIARFVR